MNCGSVVEPERVFGRRKQTNKNMKTKQIAKQFCVLLGVASLLVAPSVFANISYNGTYSGTITLNNSYGDAIAATASGLGSFTTFCLNQGVYANAGQTYNYVSSDNVVPVPTGASSPDPITLGTAWLYSEFRSGGLASYGFVYGNAASANDLQLAIWYLQGNAVGANNFFVTDAQLALTALSLGSVTNASGGAFGVFGLTLTDDRGNSAQPVLGMVPEPGTVVAGLLLLLPFGVSTVRILRKDKMA
jgi:hypothetical protein